MATVPSIPVTIPPDVAEYVAERGMQREFQQTLDRIRETVPGVRSITTEVQPPYDLGGEPAVLFNVVRDNPHLAHDPTDRDFGNWQTEAFPADVFLTFTMVSTYTADHAR